MGKSTAHDSSVRLRRTKFIPPQFHAIYGNINSGRGYDEHDMIVHHA